MQKILYDIGWSDKKGTEKHRLYTMRHGGKSETMSQKDWRNGSNVTKCGRRIGSGEEELRRIC